MRFNPYRLLVVTSLCCLVVTGFAQKNALHYLELKAIGATPAEIVLSPDYQTIIEFENGSVDTASSGRADQITVEIDEQTIRLRANQDVVNTDLTVRVGGETALFVLTSDPATSAPRRYVVRDSPPPALTTLTNQSTEGKANVASLSVGNNDLPPGVTLNLSAARTASGDIAVQYSLLNAGENSIVNDPYRLSVLNEDTKLRYTLSRIPPAGSANIIAKGQAEYGTMVIPTPPNGTLTFLWVLVEQGPGGHYTVTRDITALLNPTETATSQGNTSQAGEMQAGTGPTALTTETNPALPTTETSEGATATVASPPAYQATQSSSEVQTNETQTNETQTSETQTNQTQTTQTQAVTPPLAETASTNATSADTAASATPSTDATANAEAATVSPEANAASPTTASPADESTVNLLANASFDDASGSHWASPFADGGTGSVNFAAGEYCLSIENGGSSPWSRQLQQFGLKLEPNQPYTLSFEAHATGESLVTAHIGKANHPDQSYAQETFNVTGQAQTFALPFIMSETGETNGSVEFWVGGDLATTTPAEVCFDNIVLQGGQSSATSEKTKGASSNATYTDTESAPVTDTVTNEQTTATLVASTEAVSAPTENTAPANVAGVASLKGTNLLTNATFDDASGAPWETFFFEGARGKSAVTSGEYCLQAEEVGTEDWHVSLLHPGLQLEGGQPYTLVFDVHADGAQHLTTRLSSDNDPWTAYSQQTFQINEQAQRVSMTFTMPYVEETNVEETEQRLEFWLGGSLASNRAAPFTVCLDNLGLQQGNAVDSTALARSADNLVSNAAFDDPSGAGWENSFTANARGTGHVTNGRYCVLVQQGGENRWDVMVSQAGLSLRANQRYTLSFDAYADRPQQIMAQVSQAEEPFTAPSEQGLNVHETKRTFSSTFVAAEDEANAAVKFFFGADLAAKPPFSVCFDNIAVREGDVL
jgi:Carbohydrate binding domain